MDNKLLKDFNFEELEQEDEEYLEILHLLDNKHTSEELVKEVEQEEEEKDEYELESLNDIIENVSKQLEKQEG